jgi:hypothetical protein
LTEGALNVFTIQLAKRSVAYRYGVTILDTTVKTGRTPGVGGSIFAPTWEMVMGHKKQLITDEEYIKLYHERMNTSWHNHREIWLATIQESELAIGCMCRYQNEDGSTVFCHRHLLRAIFEKLCAKYSIPFLYYGELQ